MNLRIDPFRRGIMDTGIYVRAVNGAGDFESVDIAELDRESLLQWLRSSGGDNQLAENTVGLLLNHEKPIRP